MARQGRRGWTVIEWLVIGAVVAAVAALMLPAVQMMRNRERLSRCQDHLKFLGLALHNYHDHHKVLPPGLAVEAIPETWTPNGTVVYGAGVGFVAASTTCDSPNLAKASGLTMLAPYVEARGAYDAYNHSLACCAMANATAVATAIPAYLCPGNPRSGPAMPWGYYERPKGFVGADGPAATDYAFTLGGVAPLNYFNPFALGNGTATFGLPGAFRPGAGAFHVNSSTHFGMIKDGLANTVLMGEACGGMPLALDATGRPLDGVGAGSVGDPRRTVAAAWSQGYVSDRRGLGGFGSVFAASAFNAWYDRQCNMVSPDAGQPVTPFRSNGNMAGAPSSGWQPVPINEGVPRFARGTWMASTVPTPIAAGFFATHAQDGTDMPPAEGSMQGWRSLHAGVVPLMFGDGSVRLCGNETSPQLVVAWTSIRGGELVDVPACE